MGEVLMYVWKNKLWWLLPSDITLILFGILIAVSTVSPVGPFIYAVI